MNLARFAINKRVVSGLCTLLILILGYLAYTRLPRFEDPEFIIRQVQIVTSYPGASAREVAEEVTDVIENAVQQLQGIKEVRSVSSTNVSEVIVEFTIASTKNRSKLNEKFTQLRAKISDTQTLLPTNAGPAVVYDDFGDVYALYFSIIGEGYSLTELHEYARILRKDLVLVPGVSKVTLTGVPEEVIYLEYDSARMAQLGLSQDRIAQVLEGQSLVSPAASVESGAVRLVVRPPSAIDSLQSLEELVLTDDGSGRSFRLKDIASIRRGLKEPADRLLFRNGIPAIGVGISGEPGGNVVRMGDAVKVRISELEDLRPLGIELAFVSDQSDTVRTSVNDFVMNVVLALVIVVGTLLVFMGLRSGLLMGGILLVTVAGTLFGMYVYGLDMQRISLGALIIALGMLVDNAIVVVEGTLVRVKNGEAPGLAAISVVEQTKWPLLGGTIVGFLAFSPIGLSPDNTGEYAGSLFWTITIALLFSWLVAIWLTPFYCTLFLKQKTGETKSSREHFILQVYRRFLNTVLQHRAITLGVVAALFVFSIACFGLVKQGFFPSSTRAQFVVDYSLPESTDLDRTTADLEEIEAWIRTLDGVMGASTMVGGGHLRFMLTYDSESGNTSYGQILVDVESYQQIDHLIPAIQSQIDANYPDSLAKVWKFVLGPGGGSKIEARFSGPDPLILRRLASETKSIFAGAGAIGVKDDWGDMIRVIEPRTNGENLRRLGLTQSDVTKAIRSHFDGAPVGVYREGDELHQIILRPFEAERNNAERLWDVRIPGSAHGKQVPIAQVVEDFELVFENAKLRRFDRALSITAQADPAPGAGASEFFRELRPLIEKIDLPEDYRLEWRGEYGDSQEANDGIASTMPYGFGAMIVVVFLLFNAIRQPVIIWLTVPLALVGVIFGLALTGTPLEFMGILAVLSLTGMLIKNAIVLIDQTDANIEGGEPRLSAVVDATVSRVRPVCLGVLTTVLGVIPLLWDPFFQSLAVVIITGLSFATLLTLLVVPTLYAVLFRIRQDEVR